MSWPSCDELREKCGRPEDLNALHWGENGQIIASLCGLGRNRYCDPSGKA